MNGLTVQDIENSVQYKWRAQQAKNCLITAGAVAALMLVVSVVYSALSGFARFGENMLAYAAFVAIAGCVMLPFWLYNKSRCRYLVKNCADMPLYTVKLDTVRLRKRNFASFTVSFATERGTAKGDTAAMFCTDSAMGEVTGLSLDKFKDTEVRIAYDDKKKAIYVIG